MTEKEAKALSGMFQMSKKQLLMLDAKVKKEGFEDLIHYLMQCVIGLLSADFVAEKAKVNKRLAAVVAYVQRLQLEEN